MSDDDEDMFRFILISPDDQPYEPPSYVSASDDWSAGDEIVPGNGGIARILDVDTEIHQHLRALGFRGVFTVEPV
jgi:hypothetical protein